MSTITSIYTTNQWAAEVELWGTQGLVRADLELMYVGGFAKDHAASRRSRCLWLRGGLSDRP